nr:MAG TPA: hypothetical protein [Caudoviricetes sp.]
MTRNELGRIYAFLVKGRDAKKLEVNDIRMQAQADPALDPKLTRAYGEYSNLDNLVSVINHDLGQLEGVGPGELFSRVSSPSAKDTAIADAIKELNLTLTRLLFHFHFN